VIGGGGWILPSRRNTVAGPAAVPDLMKLDAVVKKAESFSTSSSDTKENIEQKEAAKGGSEKGESNRKKEK
jgi:hypothetical protein